MLSSSPYLLEEKGRITWVLSWFPIIVMLEKEERERLMEEKRINYNAPFLSVRRFHSSRSSELKARERRNKALNNSEKPSNQQVKREASETTASAAAPPPPLPLHRNSQIKSGPIRDPGVVPFCWEEVPGCPKGSTSAAASASASASADSQSNCEGKEANNEEEEHEGKPPGGEDDVASPAVAGEEQKEEEEEEEDAFSDAVDTLSKVESTFMNCSVSGMTGFTDGVEHHGGLYPPSSDPQTRDRDFMMGRFLPAAQAVATAGSAHNTNSCTTTAAANTNNTFRRASARGASPSVERGKPLQFNQPKQRQSFVPRYPQQQQQPAPGEDDTDDDGDDGDDGDDDSYSECGRMQMKGCGFLPRFCLKGFPSSSSSSSSSFFMNSFPGVKTLSGGPPLPLARKRSPAVKPRLPPVADSDKEQTWEAVYRHKQVGKNRMLLEDASKLTSESNRLTYWSTDSQSHEGSSPYRRSTGGDCSSPNQNAHSPQRQGKGFRGSPLKANSADSGSRGSERYFDIQPPLLTKGAPGSESQDSITAIAQHVNPDLQASPKPRWSFDEAKQDDHLQVADCNEVTYDGAFTAIPQPWKGNHPMEVGISTVSATIDPSLENRPGADIDAPTPTTLEDREQDQDAILLPPLPPPLPKTPSESWLSRTLPSVSSKHHLGPKFISKKKGEHASPPNPKWETAVKDSRRQPAQMRFSEILANPIKEEG